MTSNNISTVKFYVDTAEDLNKRYEADKVSLSTWLNLLEVAYMYTIPTRVNFDRQNGSSTNDFLYDNTATQAIPKFANNLVNFCMPTNQQWMEFSVDKLFVKQNKLSDDTVHNLRDDAQKMMDLVFIYIERSNLYSVVFEVFQDMCVGTGALLVNEGDDGDPLVFESIPISSLIFEEYGKAIFWEKPKTKLRDIKSNWPGATLSQALEEKLRTNPSDEIDLLEGIICYDDNPRSKQYYHFLQVKESKINIWERWLDYHPVTILRWKKRPGETFGRGPVLEILNDILSLNKMTEWFLMGVKYAAIPSYITFDSAILNPYNAYPTPGSLISADFSRSGGKMPIEPIPGGGKIEELGEVIKMYQQRVSDALLADPLPPPGTDPNKTATAANIRHDTWLRQNTAAAERLSNEFIKPLMSKIVHILRKKTLINDLKLNGQTVSLNIHDHHIELDYKSPVIALEDQNALQAFDRWAQRMIQLFGPIGAGAIEVAGFIEWSADKENIDLDLVHKPAEVKKMFAAALKQQQQTTNNQQGSQAPAAPSDESASAYQ